MKRTYLILAIIGFLAPNILVFMESVETGNILLYGNIAATIEAMFANRISSIFAIDLFIAVLIFFIWMFAENKKHPVKQIWLIPVLTMLFGLAFGFPLYLYFREMNKKQQADSSISTLQTPGKVPAQSS